MRLIRLYLVFVAILSAVFLGVLIADARGDEDQADVKKKKEPKQPPPPPLPPPPSRGPEPGKQREAGSKP